MFQLLFGSAIFTSAFLLFFIQPLFAKSMLPAFGGSAFVWIASILFFQVGLLMGYLYAYLLTRYFSIQKQAIIHLLLLSISIYFIPIHLQTTYIPENIWPPLSVFSILTSHILFPFIILSASSPLLQHWYCKIRYTDFPYYFYAISNAGSLIGLLGYPLLLEPLIGLSHQAIIGSLIYLFYLFLCFFCLKEAFFSTPHQAEIHSKHSVNTYTSFSKPPLITILQWVMLTFLSSTLLLSITQFLSQNVVNLPLVWILPLTLYLISFIVTFSNPKEYDDNFWLMNFLIWLGIILWMISTFSFNGINAVIIFLGLLFSACIICHGELIRLKPHQKDLTLYYLFIALGGSLGGIFVNLIAIQFFSQWWDFYLPLLVIHLFILYRLFKCYQKAKTLWNSGCLAFGVLILAIFLALIYRDIFKLNPKIIAEYRNLYGMLKVYNIQFRDPSENYRLLMHGTVAHGLEYQDPLKLLWPTTYYGKQSGVGLAFQFLRSHLNQPLNIGVVGLGCGTISALTQANDHITFYELDKDVLDIANNYFSFLKRSPSQKEIILGDARIQLQKALSLANVKKEDLLAIDAFSGDAIPFHLLTQEAMAIYTAHLNPQGILAFHITNTYLDLIPVAKGLAEKYGYHCYFWATSENFRSIWALLTHDPHLGSWLKTQTGGHLISTDTVKPILWTDDFNSILPILKWRSVAQ